MPWHGLGIMRLNPTQFNTRSCIRRPIYTQGAGVVHKTALSDVDPTTSPLQRPVGQVVTGAQHTLSHSGYPDADINFLCFKTRWSSNVNLLQFARS